MHCKTNGIYAIQPPETLTKTNKDIKRSWPDSALRCLSSQPVPVLS
jgi:hypothetical protein